MSFSLPPNDLSALAVGGAGALDWTSQVQPGGTVGVRAGRPTLRLYNESGSGLLWKMGVRSDHFPAGAWVDIPLQGETSLTYVVEYVLPGAPIALLLGTIYEAGEPVPSIPALGNSPIGIGGTVATTTGSSIKNDGNAPGTSIVEATPSDQASSSVQQNNDGSGFLKILSANVLRTVWNIVRGNSGAGKAVVQLGDSGDTSITTLYGTVGAGSIVPPSTLAAGALPAGVTIPGGQVSSAVANATNATNAGNANMVGNAVTGRDDPTNHFYGVSPTVKPAASPRGFNVEVWDGAASHFPSLLDGGGNWIEPIPGSAVTGAVASASSVPATGVTAGALPASVTQTKINSDAGQIVSDGAGNLTTNNLTGDKVTALTGAILHPNSGTVDDSLALDDRNGVFGVSLGWAQLGGGFFAFDVVNGGFIFNGATKNGVAFNGNLKQNGGKQVVQFQSAGGGAAGVTNWVGTTDPAGSAAEGDTWDKG